MDLLIAVLAVALVAVVVLVVSAPLRTARRETTVSAEQGELEAAREAKYREIRDAELDFRTGKLSHEDYRTIDATLRNEALEILNRLRAGEGGAGEGGAG